MKKLDKVVGTVLLFSVCIIFASCNKTKDTKTDITQLGSINLMKNMAAASINIKDSINNIRGKVIYAQNIVKDDDNINLTPATRFITNDLSNFAKRIKRIENMDRTDTNYYFHTIKSVYEFDDIISVLFEKKSHISGTKDTLREILCYNYDKETEKPYSFNDVFNVNSDNIQQFNKIFSTDLSLQDLTNIVFNFEKDMVWLTTQNGKEIKRYNAELTKVKKFLIND